MESDIGLAGVCRGSKVEMLHLFLFLNVYSHFLIVFFTDSIRLELHLNLGSSMCRNGTCRGDITEG